jgi:hypothetical protein
VAQLEKLGLAGQKNDLYFYLPGLANAKLGNLASRCFPNVAAATSALLDGLPPRARVAPVPEGPYVYARVPGESGAIAEMQRT